MIPLSMTKMNQVSLLTRQTSFYKIGDVSQDFSHVQIRKEILPFHSIHRIKKCFYIKYVKLKLNNKIRLKV